MSEPARDVRVIIVDDHRIVLDGLATLLDSVEGIDVVGETTSGEQAIVLADALLPDVVLMDIEMPGIGGVEATRQITTTHLASPS